MTSWHGLVRGPLEAARKKYAADGLRGVIDASYRRTLFEAYCFLKNREFEAGPKRVWVHIGAHKTGSTTFQRALKRTRSQLRESSVLLDGAALPLGRRLMRESPLPDAALGELREFWRQRIESRRERFILLSCEGFFGDPYRGYSNGGHIAHDLRGILDDYAVDIIAVVRKQDRWTESTYQQYVKEGSAATFAEFLRECGPYPLSWDELLTPWVSELGRDRVHAHLFETTFRDDVNAIERLLGGLAGPLQQVTYKSTRSNPGVSEAGLEVLRRSNEILSREDAARLRMWVESNLRSSGGYRYFSNEERNGFLRRCAESNTRLFRDYFPGADRVLYVPDASVEVASRQS